MAVLFATNLNASGLSGMSEVQIALVSLAAAEQAEISGSEAAPEPEQAKPATIKKKAAPGVKRKKRKESTSGAAPASLANPLPHANGEASNDVGSEQKTKRFGKLSLLLSLTLSPPGNDSIKPISPAKTNEAAQDALQKEFIAKQKALDDLNVQIAAMEKMIKAQQSQLDRSANSSPPVIAALNSQDIQAGTAPGAGSALGIVNDQPRPKTVVAAIQPASREGDNPANLLEMSRINQAIGLFALLLAVSGYVWYRRQMAAHKMMPGKIAVLNDVYEKTASAHPSAVAKMIPPTGAQAMKVPVHVEQKNRHILPPEYEMLEEAEINLRFGHDKLAEEVLREAIKINPKNPQSYLMLLGIYAAREDTAAFLAVAQRMRSLGDEDAWKKAAEMGRKLDPNNPIYG